MNVPALLGYLFIVALATGGYWPLVFVAGVSFWLGAATRRGVRS